MEQSWFDLDIWQLELGKERDLSAAKQSIKAKLQLGVEKYGNLSAKKWERKGKKRLSSSENLRKMRIYLLR